MTMLADGNGDFVEALGLAADFSKFGMGKRSQRWSAIVDDGVVSELNVEEPGAFSVSSAEFFRPSFRGPEGDSHFSARPWSNWP